MVRARPNYALSRYLGADRRPPGETTYRGRRQNPRQPFEDLDEGCPGAWVRCVFAASLLPFLRRRTEGGGRVPNPLLDATDDDFVRACVLYYEEQSERWHNFRIEIEAAAPP